ncbi:MAG: hypothetical protein WCF98_09505 [Synechococcus sp. ELA057]
MELQRGVDIAGQAAALARWLQQRQHLNGLAAAPPLLEQLWLQIESMEAAAALNVLAPLPIEELERLYPVVHATLSDPGQPVFISAASAWEIATKRFKPVGRSWSIRVFSPCRTATPSIVCWLPSSSAMLATRLSGSESWDLGFMSPPHPGS